jgi:hypothetical protein
MQMHDTEIQRVRDLPFNTKHDDMVFVILVHALIRNSQIILVKLKGVEREELAIKVGSEFYNHYTLHGAEYLPQLRYGKSKSYGHLVEASRVIEVEWLQSRLDFFGAQQVIKLFHQLKDEKETAC